MIVVSKWYQYGIYNVDDYTDNDDNTITIKALDNMIKFEFNYDGSELISKGEATLLQVAQDICNKAGVELSSTSFLNSATLNAEPIGASVFIIDLIEPIINSPFCM